MVVRCIAKVADAYKLDRKRKRSFQALGSVAYDARIPKWRVQKQRGFNLVGCRTAEHSVCLRAKAEGVAGLAMW